MGEYEPGDSRNVTGTAATPDGRWTAQGQQPPDAAGNSQPGQSQPAQGEAGMSGGHQPGGQTQTQGQAGMAGSQQQSGQGQMQQDGQSVGQSGDGVAGASTQDNDHTSAISTGLGAQEEQDAVGQATQTGWQTADAAGQVRPGLEVVDRDGQHVGTVDEMQGERIKLKRSDSADGQHHYVLASAVQTVDGNQVHLSCTANEAQG